MTSTIWPLLLALLLLLCLGSFLWAMMRFFVRPAGASAGAKLIGFSGVVFGLLHLISILETPDVTGAHGLSAALLYLAALALFWWSIVVNSHRPLSAVFSPDRPEHLMQNGPYRFVRHPFYCSYLFTWSAGVLATEQMWLIPTAAFMLVLYIRAARVEEEKFAHSSLAPTYQAYRQRTGLFLPNPFKWLAARNSQI